MAILAVSGCSSVPLTQSGAISTYSQLGPSIGTFGKSRIFVNGQSVLAARTASISRTTLSSQAAAAVASDEDRRLVANAVDRSLCIALSDRFTIVPEGAPSDLIIRATVSSIVPTNAGAAGISKVATLGTSAVLPVGIPRLPIGLGGLAMEAEATDLMGQQQAALTWARGANSFTSSARVSEIGDAYGLAGSFGTKFGRMLVTGEQDPDFSLPSAQRVGSAVGARPKNAVCDTFGRQSGVVGLAASVVGAPPSWTDGGGRP